MVVVVAAVGHSGGVCPPVSTGGLDLSSQNLHVCFLVCPACCGAWLGPRCPQILAGSSLRQVEEQGRLSLHLWTVLEQKVLEHRLLSVPLGKILHSPGLCFFVRYLPST